MIWNCPQCAGELDASETELRCKDCAATYPVIAEIPDFRLGEAAWIDFADDRERALILEEIVDRDGLEAALVNVFRNSRKFSVEKSRFRSRQVFAGISKCEHHLDGWLSNLRREPVLEIGSGPGQLLAAAAARGMTIAGLDVSLEWLAFSKHWIRQLGAEPVLACGLAENLPIKTGSLQSVISMDVIEHVGDQHRYMTEIGRVLQPGGRFALVTPNRFSLSPEPHVGVWGVGYLPVKLQAPWVKLVSGQDYDYTRLLSKGEARRLVYRAIGIKAAIVFPQIPDEEIVLFSKYKAKLAGAYNRIVSARLFSPVMPFIGAFFQITGTKPRAVTN